MRHSDFENQSLKTSQTLWNSIVQTCLRKTFDLFDCLTKIPQGMTSVALVNDVNAKQKWHHHQEASYKKPQGLTLRPYELQHTDLRFAKSPSQMPTISALLLPDWPRDCHFLSPRQPLSSLGDVHKSLQNRLTILLLSSHLLFEA